MPPRVVYFHLYLTSYFIHYGVRVKVIFNFFYFCFILWCCSQINFASCGTMESLIRIKPFLDTVRAYKKASNIQGTSIQVGFEELNALQLFILHYYSYYLVREGETLKDCTLSLSAVVIRLQY